MLKSKRETQNARNAKIYKLHKENLFTYSELSSMFHISRSRVGQIMMEEQQKTRQELDKGAILNEER